MTIDLWARWPGEPTRDYALFLEWCNHDPPLDAGDWYRAVLSKRPPVSRPSWEDFGDIVMRWGWLRRQESFLERLTTARYLRMSRAVEREEAAAAALEWASRGMTVALGKMSSWEKAPGALPDGVALGIVREHRGRQKDSGEIQPVANVVVQGPPTYDTRSMSDEELAALAELEARLERFRT